MAAPQALSFNTKNTKTAKGAKALNVRRSRPLVSFACFVFLVLNDSACGAHPV
jgi:hypothetical protein